MNSEEKVSYYSCNETRKLDDSDSSPSNFSTGIAVPTFSTPSYIRTIKRRGNIYVVDEQASSSIDQMIEDLYTEALSMSLDANRKAKMLKFFNILANIFLVISGAVIGVLTLNQSNTSYYYISSILGFMITGIQTLMSMFSIEKRCVLLKTISANLRKTSRQIKNLETSNLKRKDKKKKLEEYYTEMDELDLIIFDNNITTSPKNKELDQANSSGSSDVQRRKRPTSPNQRDQIIVEMSRDNK